MFICYVKNSLRLFHEHLSYNVFPDLEEHVLLTEGALSLEIEGHVLVPKLKRIFYLASMNANEVVKKNVIMIDRLWIPTKQYWI